MIKRLARWILRNEPLIVTVNGVVGDKGIYLYVGDSLHISGSGGEKEGVIDIVRTGDNEIKTLVYVNGKLSVFDT